MITTESTKISLFNEKRLRKILVNNEWYFSIVDVCAILVDSPDPGAYWRKLKQRLVAEGSQVVTFCHGLKMQAADGKKYTTDCANTEGVFRIIQSIPSPKAEPFKNWLAKIGKERLDEIENPELGMDRVKSLYQKKGYEKSWIDKRMRGISVRHGLTDEWAEGVAWRSYNNTNYSTERFQRY
jgi:DNA-damage-inducible protein D